MKVLSMFAAVALFSGIAATNAAEPVALTDAQMDGVTAGQITVAFRAISAVLTYNSVSIGTATSIDIATATSNTIAVAY